MRMSRRPPISVVPLATLLLAGALLPAATSSRTSSAGPGMRTPAPRPAPPCALRHGDPTAVVLGGDDAGTGAAWALASLGVKTLLVLTHRRDLGGDPSSFYHDGGHMVRAGGGLNDMLLCSTDSTCSFDTKEQHGDNSNVAGGPGAAFLFFDTLLRTAPLNASLEIVEGYIALPHAGTVDAAGRVSGVTLLHRDGSTCAVSAKYAVDGSPEGYGAAAFSLPVVFGREALHNESTDDPTTKAEPYAGRRSFSVNGHGPPIEAWSDRSVETVDISSGVGPITNLCQWGKGAENVSDDAHWLLTRAPAGYDPAHFITPAHGRFVDGNCCPEGALPSGGCEPEVFRYQGLDMSTLYANHTGSTGPSLPGWYLANDGKTHYLRASYANASELWSLKRDTEIKAFYWAVGGLWYIQNHMAGGKQWGFCKSSFPAKNLMVDDADIPPGPYTLADFDTSTHGGDETVAFRLYHRQVARLGAVHPVGAAQLYDGLPRVPQPPAETATVASDGSARGSTARGINGKKYWEPQSVVFPLYGTDFTKGVLGATVSLPAGCTGDCGDGVLMGNGPSDGNMHGMSRSLFTPDPAATKAALTADDFPPAGVFTRTFVENFLSPGTPRSTFMLQSSARIGCFASNIGVASGAVIGLSERHGFENTSAVPTMLVQHALGAELSTAITYFAPPLRTSLRQRGDLSAATYAAMHIAGAYAVPPLLAVGNVTEGAVAASDMEAWLGLYKEGVMTGRITPPTLPPSPTPPADACLANDSWFAYVPDWDVTAGGKTLRAKAKPTFKCKEGALLKKCQAKSTTLPPADVHCYRPSAIVQLKAPPQPSSNNELLLVELLPPAQEHRPSQVALANATRAQLSAVLESIYPGSAAHAVAAAAISGSAGALSFTLAELAHVVTRHAACMRGRLHGEDIMGALGLEPYKFHGDE
eukprot:SAG22_NODE_60_length_23423_cov_8.445250_7_plen_926_part_00